MDRRIAAIGLRLDRIDARLDIIEQRLDLMDKRMLEDQAGRLEGPGRGGRHIALTSAG
jgi:hypothetical protein